MSASRVRLTTGTLPAPRFDRLVASHPFIEQIDVVFPSRAIQGDAFTSLKATYSTAQFTLSEVYATASNKACTDPCPLQVVPIDDDTDDTWCIDPRGVLTLSVSKTLYEQLGLVGKKLPFKGCPERYVIGIPLQRAATSTGMQARYRAAMDVWDRVRRATGHDRWRVAYAGTLAAHGSPSSDPATHDVTPRVRHATDVCVPRPGDLVQADETQLEALFELRADDRVDPYVAVYTPPSPSAEIAEVTHVRWDGHVIDGALLRSVIDTAVSIVSLASASCGDDCPLISITLHSNLATPVSYVPECLDKEASPRVPGLEAEDAVCLVLSKTSAGSTWAIAECIGKWDARWGG